ncbi:metalloprotease PmbA [Buchnera aphidicola]|uniref:metalloprotease PmbA n=1 Tax=Buchnera aphidicola TaxID=9 RepID=UPI003463B551
MQYDLNKLWNNQSDFKELILYILSILKKDTHSSEVVIKKTLGISLNTRNYKVENVEFRNDNLICITVYKNFKKGVSFSTDLSIQGIQKTVNAALDIMKHTSEDYFSGLPDPNLLSFKSVKIKLFYPSNFNILEAIKRSNLIEKYSRDYDSKILNIENINFSSYMNSYVLGNSYGMLQGYETTLHSISNTVISRASTGMERAFSYTLSRELCDLKDCKWIAHDASKKSISRLYSRKIKTIKSPVIISSEITDDFFSYFVSAISGINVYRKSTCLLHSLYKKIFPDWLSITENPHIDKGLFSKPFDSEGVMTQTRIIVKKGILNTWLLNNYYAKKNNLVTTGHAGGIYNWFVSGSSNISFKNLLRKMFSGLIVTEFLGEGVNIVTGNYSIGVFGYWVEKGEIIFPVHEITISGNLKDMWKNILDISNDFEDRTSIHCGSILLSEMQISGI